MEVIDQQVINDNKEIYAKIQSELVQAEFEILIASAWFTDEELFNILLNKLKEGVRIEIIVADNQENERLDFDLLVSKGAAVYKIKSSGYGGMNQKFCVIDKRIALHGSYNWTMNAKKNNQESIISTNHQETITSLINNFDQNKTRIMDQKTPSDLTTTPQQPDRPKGVPIELPIQAGGEFERLLDSMIAAEVGNFDRQMLREQGFERCKANNGDHQVLHKSFDTLYSVFINDIDVIEDKKRRLIAKIEEHRVKNLDHLSKNCEQKVEFLNREHELTQSSLKTKRTLLEADQEIAAKNIDHLKSDTIPPYERQSQRIAEEIKLLEREFLRPRFKWFEFIPTVIFSTALLVYLFLFYSSAAYILLFGVSDAKAAADQGLSVPPAQIFNPDAIGKALHKSGTAPYFIFLFVFIPLALAVIDRFVSGKWVPWIGVGFGIIVLDGAVAYKVTQAIHEVNYAGGLSDEVWTYGMAFTDPNFYLVFVFGAAGLFLFKLAFKKLMYIFEERDPDILAQRTQLLIKQYREEIAVQADQIAAIRNEIAEIERSIIQTRSDIKQIDAELGKLPVILNQTVQNKKSELASDAKRIGEIAAIYTQHILSDNLPVSVDALKDRINVFLEGWNDMLYQEFAVPRAMLKTAQAAEVAISWQERKMNVNNIDKRIKVN